jgi:DNA invertase Pin-like site-specific DNA recombinase
MLIGYGWPSEEGEDHRTLELAGCKRIFYATELHRRAIERETAIEYLREGDCLVVADLDRLGDDLEQIVLTIGRLHRLGASIMVEKHGVIPGTTLGDSFAQACDLLADMHRLLRNKSALRSPGRDLAPRTARGRPTALTAQNKALALKLLTAGGVTVADVASRLGVSAATIYRHLPRRTRSTPKDETK